jgi:methylaspartate mutase epsilon subunit
MAAATAAAIPAWDDAVAALRALQHTAPDALRAADASGRPFVQPRCGVGGHRQMISLLRDLAQADPGMLSITIDSHTRLKHFDTAARVLAEDPGQLNGYPLVAHGWRRGQELARAIDVPLEVRHGSPDARDLFAVAIAAGITSFEGGGISYNLPYSKDVPLHTSLEAWRQVDATCGRLAAAGVVIDRELFGTLTGVLVPPSISLAVTLLEAIAAARSGVRCLSIAYPQGGEVHQDIAALRSIRVMARRYLPADVTVYPVLHEFMGVFPPQRADAEALILYGGLTARLGGATKVISKTYHEALGIPSTEANYQGIRTAAMGCNELLDFVRVDDARVEEEAEWIQQEVAELINPVLDTGDLPAGITAAFAEGRLDIPFSASVHARSEVIPARDNSGAIRLYQPGNLPISARHRRRHSALLDGRPLRSRPIDAITADINYFLRADRPRLRSTR